MTVQTILDYIWTLAPAEYKMSWDNVGLLLGRSTAEVRKCLLALDATAAVADEAKALGCELVVTHHPVIFRGDKHVTDLDPLTEPELRFLENRIAVISMHTNLDCAPGGVNDVLAALLGLQSVETLAEPGEPPLVRCGTVEEQSLASFAAFVKKTLNCPGLRYVDAGRPVRKVALVGGSAIELAELALAAGCDTFVTGDVKYHEFLNTAARGMNVIDAGHFETENPVVHMLLAKLRGRFPEVEFLLSAHRGAIRFL